MLLILRKRLINRVKELDAFPKISEDHKRPSAVGGTFSLATYCIMIYLIYSETMYFLEGQLTFEFEPDTSHDRLLPINIDLTVACPCNKIGADIIDYGHKYYKTKDLLKFEDTWWEMSPKQKKYFDGLKRMNSYLREEYHAIHEVLWKNNRIVDYYAMPERDLIPNRTTDACRIYGTAPVSKVAGNIHIIFGKRLNITGKKRIYVFSKSDRKYFNFTHRINKFSFGNPSPGIIHPLQGIEKNTIYYKMRYQYSVQVVSTDVNLLMHKTNTYQYSVKEFQRVIDRSKKSYGISGIYFDYDISALKIKVSQKRDSISQYLVKLCATIGCIFVTNGLLNNVVQFLLTIFFCNFSKISRCKNIKVSDI